MADESDSNKDELARDQARLLLERWSPFARVSRRLLADLAERSTIKRLEPEEIIDFETRGARGQGFIAVPLRGSLETTKGKPVDATTFVGPMTGESGAKPESIRAGGNVGDPKKRKRRVEPAIVALVDAGSATPDLAWSVEAHRLAQTDTQKKLRRQLRSLCRPELVWLDTDVIARAHLEPLAHLLAYTLARELDESTAVVTLGPDGRSHAVLIWDREKYPTYSYPVRDFDPLTKRAIGRSKAPARRRRPLTAEDLYALVDFRSDRPRRSHVFVIDVEQSDRPRTGLATNVKFDRIVYLTDRIPEQVPAHLRPLLDDRLFAKDDEIPYFCSFIPSVVVARDVRKRTPRARSFKARRIRTARRGEQRAPYPFLSRIERDACVVPVDVDALGEAWRRWNTDREKPFLDALPADCMAGASVSRWGRAITNRRIGLALSGGGACAFRAGPILESMARANMPIDVLAGLSGGALVGAFYCHSGMTGFNQLVKLGPWIQLTVPLATLTTWPMETGLDLMLGGTRVEDLEVRLAAVAVALPPDDSPMTQVVVSGTIGEAVRVSGTLPPVFAKTSKAGLLFSDGGAGNVVPAQVARDFGADIVLAVNAIPGPSSSNPIPWWLRPAVAIAAPWVQRQVDYYAWHSYFWRTVSQRFLREADTPFEFAPWQLSLLEAGEWLRSADIVERARQQTPDIDAAVADLRKQWQTLGDRWWLRDGWKEKYGSKKKSGKKGKP